MNTNSNNNINNANVNNTNNSRIEVAAQKTPILQLRDELRADLAAVDTIRDIEAKKLF